MEGFVSVWRGLRNRCSTAELLQQYDLYALVYSRHLLQTRPTWRDSQSGSELNFYVGPYRLSSATLEETAAASPRIAGRSTAEQL